jgi:hypothetical protein
MTTLTGMSLAIAIDILLRVSLVLMAGLLVALSARRNAALRHAILVTGLVGVFLMPTAMLTVPVLPVSRWQLGSLGSTTLRASPRAVRDRRADRITTPRVSTIRPPRRFP